MKFCTNCGNAVGEGAKFCTSCGQPVSGATPEHVPLPLAPPVPHTALDYTIQGDNLQIIRIKLKPGQELYAEAGRLDEVFRAITTHDTARAREART